MDYQNQHQYDDILNLPHPTSKNHPRMSLHDRAAQFSPFAALTGHEAAIKETARLTDDKQILSEDVIEKINGQLKIIAEKMRISHIKAYQEGYLDIILAEINEKMQK